MVASWANYEIADPNLLPCCNPDFSSIRESSLIYVDKTEIIAKIARQRTPIFFSRPRRFGKSLLVNTLSSLFSDGLRCFHGLDIEKIWNDKTYPVVVLDFSGLASRDAQEFKKGLCKRIITQFNYHKFSTTDIKDEHPADILDEIVKELDNKSIVLLVDEYDAPLTHHLNDRTELSKIMATLNDFYAVVKQYTGKFRLIFITGVTRTSHVSIFSAFNNLIDLSFSEEYGYLLGFTYDDLLKYFDNYVCMVANFLEMTKGDVYARIKQYYDGFRFSFKSKQTVYNPWSILNFLMTPKNGFFNYWFDSGGTPSLLIQYFKINNSYDFLDYSKRGLLIGTDELLNKYEITEVPAEVLMYQTGYYTIHNE